MAVLLQHELPFVLVHFLEDLDFGVQMLSVGQLTLEEVLEGRQGLAFELAGLLPRQVAEVTAGRERQVAHHLAMDIVFANCWSPLVHQRMGLLLVLDHKGSHRITTPLALRACLRYIRFLSRQTEGFALVGRCGGCSGFLDDYGVLSVGCVLLGHRYFL